MRTRLHTATVGIGLFVTAMLLWAVAPVVAQQSKVVLAQIINTEREPVPIVDVGVPAQTAVVFDEKVFDDFTAPIDVGAFGRIRIVVGASEPSYCTVRVFLQHGHHLLLLEELPVTPSQGATAVFEVPGRTLRLDTFYGTGGGNCSTEVVIYGRP
jgi:hypothetical protein